jgi:hypothetical protein
MDLTLAQRLIEHCLGHDAAAMNISAREGSSRSMREFIQHILDVGIRAGRQSKMVTGASLYQGITCGRLADEIRTAGVKFERESMRSFGQVKFVSVAIDAGTVLRLPGIYAIIWNPHYIRDFKPILMDLSTGSEF